MLDIDSTKLSGLEKAPKADLKNLLDALIESMGVEHDEQR